MVVDRSPQIGVRCGHLAAALRGFLRESLVTRRLVTPNTAPIIPSIDPCDQPLQIVGIYTRCKITRSIVRKYKSNRWIVRHEHL